MIKRRFYRVEHGEKDDASSDSSSSSSSSSSSDESEVEPQVSDNDDDVDDDGVNNDVNDDDDSSGFKPQHPSFTSSGYESEDSSGNEIDADTTGLITRDDDSESESDRDQFANGPVSLKDSIGTVKMSLEDLPVAESVPSCVLKSKAAYKCRLCPKIVCLNEESLNTHLKSKRHARSEKLLNDGRLKRYLNSDGEEEVMTDDDGETHAERHARILAMAQKPQDLPKKTKGRQRQRERLKRKKQKNSTDIPNSGKQRENRAKRRRKNLD